MRTWITLGLALATSSLTLACGGNAGGDDDVADAAAVDAATGDPDAGPPMLMCNSPDLEAPELWLTAPIDRAIGEAPATTLVFRVADGCGVVASSIILRIGTAVVTPVVTGDPRDLRIEYDPPADFALDAIVTASLEAADLAGNALTGRLTFRIWDDYILGFRELAGMDSTAPGVPSGWNEYFHIEATAGGGQRMVARMEQPGGTLWPAGIRFVTARLHACVMPVSTPRTVAVYRLNGSFDGATTSWIQRSSLAAWAAPGAEAVPQDREATPFATLDFPLPSAGAFWSEADSADITPLIQTWYDGPPQSFGMILVGTPGDVDVNNGNCPPWILGRLGRPLPASP